MLKFTIRKLKKELARTASPEDRKRLQGLIASRIRRRRLAISGLLVVFGLVVVALYFEVSIVARWRGKPIYLEFVPKGANAYFTSVTVSDRWHSFVRKGRSPVNVLGHEAKAYHMCLFPYIRFSPLRFMAGEA